MATLKKNQMNNILFPMVDGTDFATIESGLTASDFESKVTKKYYGVTHGNSTAASSGTISKTVALVHSGIFQQTLKASECNFDQLLVALIPSNTSLAEQILVFNLVTYDDSDMFSQLSDIGSNLLSYLVGMSGAISDIESQVDLLATSNYLSQVHSDLKSAIGNVSVTLTASDISDIGSAVAAAIGSDISDIYSLLSDHHSEFLSRVNKQVANFSQLSDIDSNLLSYLAGLSGLISDVDSQVNLLATSNYLSQVHSDLRSQVSGITAGVSASDISDIASAVWAAKYTGNSQASSFGSLMSDIFSRLALAQSNISDVESQLDLNASVISDVYSLLSDHHSDFQSRVNKQVANFSQLSDIDSNLLSYLLGLSGMVSDVQSALSNAESNILSYLLGMSGAISDVESALDSQFLIITSDISDIYSLLDSRVPSTLTSVVTRLSQVDSGVDRLQQAHIALFGSTASTVADASALEIDGIDHDSEFNGQYVRILSGSQIQELRLIVDTNQTNSQLTVKPAFNSRLLSGVQFVIFDGNPYQSALYELVSDVESQLDLTASVASDTYSLVQDVDSQLLLNASNISDIESALDSQFLILLSNISDIESQVDLLATSNYLSQVHSDLYSAIGNVSVALTPSDISDIASAVAAAVGSDISDIYSLLSDHHSEFLSRVNKQIANFSQLSDVNSNLLSYLLGISGAISDVESQVDLLATSNYLSQVHSDLRSQVSGITAGVSASDISDIASAVWANIIGARVDSRVTLIQSNVSDVESALDSQYLVLLSNISDIESQVDLLATSNYLSQVHSDLYSAIGNVSVALTASDISDIASAVAAAVGSDISDLYSLLSDHHSEFLSRVDKKVANYSQLSNIDSNLLSFLGGMSGVLSDAYSLTQDIDSQLLLNASNISDIESQLDVSASVISDIQSALDSQFNVLLSNISDIESQVDLLATSNYLSQVHSDLYSAIGNVSVTLSASDISDIASAIAGGVTIFPAGAIAYTYTVTDSVTGNPIDGVDIWVSTDLAGVNVIWSGATDALGIARDINGNLPMLDAGTYYFWKQIAGYIDDDSPDTEVVS